MQRCYENKKVNKFIRDNRKNITLKDWLAEIVNNQTDYHIYARQFDSTTDEYVGTYLSNENLEIFPEYNKDKILNYKIVAEENYTFSNNIIISE